MIESSVSTCFHCDRVKSDHITNDSDCIGRRYLSKRWAAGRKHRSEFMDDYDVSWDGHNVVFHDRSDDPPVLVETEKAALEIMQVLGVVALEEPVTWVPTILNYITKSYMGNPNNDPDIHGKIVRILTAWGTAYVYFDNGAMNRIGG